MKILSNNIAVLENDTHISKWVEESGRLDHDQAALEQILPHIKEGDFVFDIGAFIGDHTIAYCNAVGPAGRVYAFEPNPSAYKCLMHNCPTAQKYDVGFSDQRESLPLQIDPNAGGSYVSRQNSPTSVELLTLDMFDLDRLDFLKMDIEGYEVKALNGGKALIEKLKPVMWIEVNRGALERNETSPEELESLVESLGYTVTPYPERGEQYDILCLPKEA